MKERLNKIREHVIEYKETYIAGAICLLAGYTLAITRERHASLQSGLDEPSQVTMRSLFLFSNHNKVVVNEREGRGHPGYIVRCLETLIEFPTQADAARAMDLSPAVLSSHINGRFDNVNGYHFERVAA